MNPTPINQVIGRREGRRFRAFELHRQAWKQKDIGAALGVTHGAVSQWRERGREEGGLVAGVPRLFAIAHDRHGAAADQAWQYHLLHGIMQDAAALPMLIRGLKEKGLTSSSSASH